MRSNVTTTLAQLSLATATTLAFVFPSPDDVIETVWEVVHRPQMEITIQADDVVIQPGSVDTTEVIAFDEVADCLDGKKHRNMEALTRCTDLLFANLREAQKPAPTNPFARLVKHDLTDDDDYEGHRLALTRLCRAIWAEKGGDVGVLETTACYWMVQGVEKPV